MLNMDNRIPVRVSEMKMLNRHQLERPTKIDKKKKSKCENKEEQLRQEREWRTL